MLSVSSSAIGGCYGRTPNHGAASSNTRCCLGLRVEAWESKKNPKALVKLVRREGRGGGRVVVKMSMEAGVGVMGTKLGMMSYFEADGEVVPVTVVGFKEGNIVTQVKTEGTDGYSAVQVGYQRVRDRKLTKPEMGHLQKAGAIPMRHLQEFRLLSVDSFHPNQRLILDDLFKEGDLVDVSGTTIGKGFQGSSLFLHFILFLTFLFLNVFFYYYFFLYPWDSLWLDFSIFFCAFFHLFGIIVEF